MPTLLTSGNIEGIQFKHSNTPDTPAAGYTRVFYDPDGTFKARDESGTVTEIGAGGGGGGGATTELDNLGTTAVNADVNPDTDITHSLGSLTERWLAIYTQFFRPSTLDWAADSANVTLTAGGNLDLGSLSPAYARLLAISANSGTEDDLIDHVNFAVGGFYLLRAAVGHTIHIIHDAGRSMFVPGGNQLTLKGDDLVLVWCTQSIFFVLDATVFYTEDFRLSDGGNELDFDLSAFTGAHSLIFPDSDVNLGTDFAAASHNHDADYADIAHVHDANVVTFTPSVGADWDGDTDPGNVDDALDQLAERVDDLEGALSGTTAIATGTYTGDGNATQAITGVGFQPDIVEIYPQTDNVNPPTTVIKTDQDGTKARYTYNDLSQYEDDAIISLDADGFTVGDNTSGTVGGNVMNVSARVYAWMAWKA